MSFLSASILGMRAIFAIPEGSKNQSQAKSLQMDLPRWFLLAIDTTGHTGTFIL